MVKNIYRWLMKYRNPVLQADFSDPDVIRDGDYFYMVSSSFNFNPCIPVLRSQNLVEWELYNYVMDSLPLDEYKSVQHGGGVWAPAIRKHAGTYYCVFPLYGHGIWVCETKDIGGKWSAPRRLLSYEGLEDPCPIWTDDGKCYMAVAFCKSKAGFNSVIAVYEVTPDLTAPIGGYKIVYDGHNDNPCIEGPKFYYKEGYFYIYAPAGGVKHGWQTALRSKNIYGPYESKIVMYRGDSCVNGPHQGALVDLKDGGWAFVHFSDKDAYGRVTYLQPAVWQNDWWLCGEVKDALLCGSPVEEGDYPVKIHTGARIGCSDSFARGISPVWQTPAVCGNNWYSACGGLTVTAKPHKGGAYNLGECLTQRFPCYNFSVRTELCADSGAEGVLAVLGNVCYSLCLADGKVSVKSSDKGGEKTLFVQEYAANNAVFGLDVKKEGGDAVCRFTVNGKPFYQQFCALQGRWVGARIALYATGCGKVKFSYFEANRT